MNINLRINAARRRYGRALCVVFALATLAAPQSFDVNPKPPETRAEALVETLHGVKVGDPFLLRVEMKAGHGAGKPTSKIIEEYADIWGFLVRTFKMNAPAS